VIARSLDWRFRVQASDRAVSDLIGYLACTPEIVGPPPREMLIQIENFRGRLRVVKDGASVKEVLGALEALDFVHVLLFQQSIGDRPHAAVLHAACLRRNGHRLLLVGAKGAGKSTLALRLVDAGYEIEGDENVFVLPDRVVARPRACRVKEASLGYLPAEMAEAIVTASHLRTFDGERIFNVDPRVFGCSWRIEEGKADFVFVLRPNHGGYSSIRPMQPSAMVEFLVSEIAWREDGRGGSVAALAALASHAKAYDLSLGDHASAIRCVEAAISC
jgi:hypothetical protein